MRYIALLPGLLLIWLGLALPLQAADKPAPKDDPAFLKQAALAVYKQVANFYRRQRLEVPPVSNDAKFLRRAFLVTTGRIPTAEEARFFLEIEEKTKREELVTYLLQSDGYSSHLTNWAFDLLRVVDRKSGSRSSFEPYRHWVRTAMEKCGSSSARTWSARSATTIHSATPSATISISSPPSPTARVK